MAKKEPIVKECELTIQSQESNKELERESLIKQVEAEYGKGAIFLLGKKQATEWEFRSTGSIGLDIACGGGIPKGAPIVIHGAEGVGKSSIACMICAEAQKNGEEIFIVEPEQAFNPNWARKLGMYIPQNEFDKYPEGYGGVWFHQPCSPAEDTLDFIEFLVDTKKYGIIVLDSIPALVTKAEIDGGFADRQVGEQARLVAKAMRKLVWTGKLRNSGTSLICINQIRDKIGTIFGGTESTGWQSIKICSY